MSALLLPAVEATTAGNPTLNIGIFLAFVVFMNRYLVAGLTAGATKG